ncbi:glycosyltransferase family 1 protein [Marinobacter sp. chi1]|uniref:Glycosyltransferase family 1 protein n=1 Tax=Marinobacter suaedae TaxID=3057675 RepID=A0ABT8VWL4_9GAMM|nr:glycosyltransferase family 1 protein [Marinobacter sp. chi1]MDO3720323.1 glycosyltransferase family 1 protein [Marinobacter sp. chi1]
MKLKPIRLLFDANSMVMRTGRTHLSGIGRTALELARALDELNDPAVDIRLLTQTFRGHIPESFRNLAVRNIPWPIGPRYDWLKQRFPLLETLAPYDLLYEPSNFAPLHRPDKTVVTIHDAMFFSYPESFLGHDGPRQHAPAFAQRARAIATPSKASKADIVKYMGVDEDKVTVIPWGVDRGIFNANDKLGAKERVARATGCDRRWFVAVSCDIGRKNTISVLRAFKAALAEGIEHDLLLVWGNPPADYLQEFAAEVESGRIRFLKHVDDTLLGDLYAGATASWFPSRYEGFGLPVLESLACGTPVVTCRNSSLAEVGGEAAIYVEPDGIDEMAELMREFDASQPAGAHGPQACLGQAAKFRWDDTAKAYLALFKAAAE